MKSDPPINNFQLDRIDFTGVMSSLRELMKYENRIAGTDNIKKAS